MSDYLVQINNIYEEYICIRILEVPTYFRILRNGKSSKKTDLGASHLIEKY